MLLRRLTLIAITIIIGMVSSVFSSAHAQSNTPTPTPDRMGCIPDPSATPRFNGARPESLVLQDVDLLSQPQFEADSTPLKIVTIPQNARVVVFDIDNIKKQWYRVLWACDDFAYAGWVPVDAVKFFSHNVNPKAAPPGCVKTMATISSVDDTWTSTVRSKIVAVFDLFRKPSGTLIPPSFIYLTRNGRELSDRGRQFTTSGPFLLNGVVISTGTTDIQPGTEIGFSLVSPTSEPLRFFATLYSVPEGCQWDG